MNFAITLDILIKKEETYYSAHCLQFDLVATDDTIEGVQKAIYDLCSAHIENSLAYDNKQNLFSPAPAEIWAEYWAASDKPSCYLQRDRIIIPDKDKTFNLQEIVCNV